jgi:putative cardiolipin synthase
MEKRSIVNFLAPVRWSRAFPGFMIPILFLLAGGCASLPEDFEQVPSQAWQQPEQTMLGAFIAETAPADKSLSGVELIADPSEAFSTRFAIAAFAEKTLDMQYYLWKGDLSGQLLLWRVLEAADRGVRVRFLIDDIFHAGRDEVYAALDVHPNFELRVFNPMANRGAARNLNYLANKRALNHRMHNKIFMADGAVAVLGGRNIGDDYFGVNTKANFFDLDVLTVGQGVVEAGAAFDEYWNSRYAVPINVLTDRATESDLAELRRELEQSLQDKDAVPYALAFEAEETLENLKHWREQLIWAPATVVVDPLERFEGQGESAIVRFASDTVEHIDEQLIVESAYLIPDRNGLPNIAALVDSGVEVKMLTNSLMSNNHITAHSGYMKYRKDILATGTDLHELRADAALREHFKANDDDHEVPAGIHTKAFVIDGRQALIGSFNFDPRSRDLNSEIGLVVNSEEFAGQVVEHMLNDFDEANSYHLFLDDNGKLRWRIETENGTEIVKHDPGASIWRRMGARMLSWLPIEKEL